MTEKVFFADRMRQKRFILYGILELQYITVVRKLKEKVLADGRLPVEGERLEEVSPRLLGTVVFAALGLVMPQGAIYGNMAPFGISLAAAVSGTGSVLVYIACLIGYLLSGEMWLPLRYMAAVAVTGATRWTFSVLPTVSRKKLFAPILAFAATLASGLLMSGGLEALGVLLTVAESLAAGGFAYFFAESYAFLTKARNRTVMTMPEQTGFVLIGATVLMALAPLEWYHISPGRILAGVLVMLFARSGREQSGTVAGTVLGAALALSDPGQMYVSLALAFGGLLAGIFSRYGRFAVAGVYLIANLLVYLTAAADLAAAAAIYEVSVAAVVFILLPRRVDKLLRRFLVYGQHLPAVEGLRRSMTLRLDVAAKAMKEVADTVESVSKKLTRYGAPDLGTMYRHVGDTVCKTCNLNLYCWENNFSEVMDAFNQLTPLLREKEVVGKEDLGGFLSRSCRRPREVAEQITRGYQMYRLRESAWDRLSEIRGVITDQFTGMGDMLCELGERFASEKRVDVETAGRVISLCEDFGMPVEEAVCLLDRHDRLTVEILAEDVGVCLDGGRWFRELQLCCGRDFDRPSVLEMQGMVKITLTERPLFSAEVGVAQHTGTGEKMSGDVWEQYTDGGQHTLIISDGMGSGGRAAVDGAMASGITARLLRAGLEPDTVLKMVNTALLAKSGDESLTTLDILQTDLFTGKIRVMKAGAASSLLKSGERVSRIEAPSLPIGILRETGFATHADTLTDGDVLLMMSDGVLEQGTAWIEEYLRDAKEKTARQLADGVLEEACRRADADGHADDMTVAAVFIHRNTAVKAK